MKCLLQSEHSDSLLRAAQQMMSVELLDRNWPLSPPPCAACAPQSNEHGTS